MRPLIGLMILVCCLPGSVLGQRDLEPRQLIESPTAGLLPRGSFGLDFRFHGSNGILGAVSVGLFNQVMFGVSFGGQDLLGNGSVEWNPRLEFSGRVRVVEEGYSMPAVAVGYHSQGYGAFDEDLDRYTSKSKGVYAVFSKNYKSSLGQVGFHTGINKSFEDDDGDKDLSGFVGVDKAFGRNFVLLAEYDLALNDNADNSLGSGKGLLNAGVRWTVSEQLSLEFDVKNVFRNGQRNPNPDREIRIVYFERF